MRSITRAKFRVKIKSLAEESKIIRREAHRYRGEDNEFVRGELHSHRVIIVRLESRATQWAYAFMRGVPYSVIEPDANLQRDERRNLLIRSAAIAKSLGGWASSERLQDIREWLDGETASQEAA